MAQTKYGAAIVAAQKARISVEEYLRLAQRGMKRCTKCKEWKVSLGSYSRDASRHDGLSAKCHACVRVKIRKSTKGRISNFKGRRHTDEAKARISAATRSRPSPMLGKHHSVKSRIEMSITKRALNLTGARCPQYIDGKSAERRGQRHTKEAKRWRYDVYARDNFTCMHCGDNKGGNLNAHHITPFAAFPELRFVLDNGITLCDSCHWLAHQVEMPGL